MALSSFRILDTIHHSRRFVLYRAEAQKDNARVLIKTQDPTQVRDQALFDSLKCEADTATTLLHPNIRRGIAHFSEGLSGYLVAEYAPGLSLAEYLLQNPDAATLQQCLVWARDILHALHYAEKQSIRHYNLNPYNIIIDEAARLKIIGFGKDSRDPWKHSEGNFNYPFPMLYVAPEIFRSSSAHPNSDLYSWAVILYQMLCKSLPWRLDSFIGPDEQKLQSFSRGVSMPDAAIVPDGLYSILLSCLKQDPNERIKDISELLEILSGEFSEISWLYEEPEAPEAEPPAEDEIPVPAEPEAPEPIPEEPKPVAEPEPIKEPQPDPENDAKPLEPQPAADIAPSDESPLPKESSRELPVPEDEPPAQDLPNEAPVMPAATEPLGASATVPDRDIEPDESAPKAEDDLPKDKAQAIAPKSQATISKDEAPKKAPSPKPVKIAIAAQPAAIQEPKDLKNMKKIFITLMILSFIIIGYIFVDHYFIKEKPQYELSMEEPEIDLEEITEPLLNQNIPIEMIWVPADTLIMGSISPDAGDDEFPLLTIPLKGFMISPTEITQAQWMMVSSVNPSLFVGDDLPVENVSFYDAVEYCNAKSIKDGLSPAYDFRGTTIICDFDANGYRLPTEAEWEFAAKAGIGKSFSQYSGSDDADSVGWYAANSNDQSQPVGKKDANALGIYDMSGNVYEWVWNWYAPYSYRVSSLFSGPQDGTDKVIRGGSWYHKQSLMRNTARNFAKPYQKNSYIGFRVVRSR